MNFKSKKTFKIEALEQSLTDTLNSVNEYKATVDEFRQRDIKRSQSSGKHQAIRSFFDAADINRFTSNIFAPITSPTQEKASELQRIRGVSRELRRNSPFISNYVWALKTNVYGDSGFTLQGRVNNTKKALHGTLNSMVEDGWADFTRKGVFEVSARHTLKSFIYIILDILATDGEVIIRKLKGFGKYGIQYQLIDNDCLKALGRTTSASGNTVYNGVEVDQYNRVVAYHLITNGHPAEGACKTEPIPASEIIHLVENPYRVNDTRGLPWTTPVLFSLNQLEGYREAEVIAARLQAVTAIFFTTRADADEDAYGGPKDAQGQDFPTDIEPGSALSLPIGSDAKLLAPTHPNNAFEGFSKAMLKEIASALHITYNSLVGDYESTSFSSCKAAFVTERLFYKSIQNIVIEDLLDVMYQDFIDFGTFKGVLKAPMVNASYDYLKQHQFVPSGFTSVDELKDNQADALKLDIGKTTQSDLLAEDGKTLEDWLKTKQKEKDLYAQYGFPYEPDKAVPVVPPPIKQTIADIEASNGASVETATAMPNNDANGVDGK